MLVLLHSHGTVPHAMNMQLRMLDAIPFAHLIAAGGGSHYAGLGVHVAAPAAPKPVTDADLPAGLGGLGSNSAPGASAAAAGGTASGTDGAGGTAGGTGTPSFDDMYASYRNIRSGGYHAMIMANSAKAQMMSVVPRGLGPPR